MENFIPLPNILGTSNATDITVQLYNSVRPIQKDEKGVYHLIAIKPFKNGVLIEKRYL